MKTKVSLIPADALIRVADLLTKAGQGKHSDEKWKTMTVENHVNATLRHILHHLSGETVDTEFCHTHLVHAAARLLMAVALQKVDVGRVGQDVQGAVREHFNHRHMPPCPTCGGVAFFKDDFGDRVELTCGACDCLVKVMPK